MTRRRGLLAAAGGSLFGLAGCPAREAAVWRGEGGWVGADAALGHRLRRPAPDAAPEVQRRAEVVVVGAGIAGLSAARGLRQASIDDVHVLDLEAGPGGNSRGHRMAGIGCPLGAHYLPVPGPQADDVAAWLDEIGLRRRAAGRAAYDERHLCHSPQERLFFDGAWHDGLLPPADPSSATQAQYRRFAAAVDDVRRSVAFAVPTHAARWSAGAAALDAQTFAAWLDTRGLGDARLRWYLDYCCRDDYGAPADTVSAWAGIHYFASRHGFAAPGDDDGERDPVLTWPEGNAWLVERLARPLGGDRLHVHRLVLRVRAGRHDVQVDVWDAQAERIERWTAPQVVMAVPLFIAARLVDAPPPALVAAAAALRHAPWLVANLQLDEPLLDRPTGAAPSWDNVVYGSDALGYVDARHQELSSTAGPTVLTAYRALPVGERAALLDRPWDVWARRMVADLAGVHPDLPRKLRRADLMRYGHAMSIPVPGVRGHPALATLADMPGRLHYAHADLSGYSIFEEAFAHGLRAARRIAGARPTVRSNRA